jgi:FAD synthase
MLGRFQPWHAGHTALFKEALKKTGQVAVTLYIVIHGTLVLLFGCIKCSQLYTYCIRFTFNPHEGFIEN